MALQPLSFQQNPTSESAKGLAVPSGNKELVERLTAFGKKIGQMAEGLEKYCETGGIVYARKTKPRGDEGGDADS